MSRRAPARSPTLGLLALVLIGAVVFSPAILSRFWLDDYAQMAMVEGTYPAKRGPFDLYDYVGESERGVLVDAGMLPWWTTPRYKLRFFRPLSSALLWSEYQVTHRDALVMHLISFAWWAATVALARALFRALFKERVATVGAIAFALAPCHAMPIAWVADREVLVSLAFGAAGLWALHRGGWPRIVLATVAFALSVAAGEYGICVGAYVLAFTIARADLRPHVRAASLAAFAVPALAYLAVRSKLGYGTAGSGFYHDPLASPAAYALGAPRRLATLLVDAWTTIDFDEFGATAAPWALAAIVAGCALALARPLRATLRDLADAERRAASWLLAGSFLSLVPVLSVAPATRLVSVCALGVAPVAALVLEHAWFKGDPADQSLGITQLRAAAALLAFFQLVHGPVGGFLAARTQHATADEFERRVSWLHERSLFGEEIIVARAGWSSVLFAPVAIELHRPLVRWSTLVPSDHALMLRTGPRVVELVMPHATGFFDLRDNDLFRDPSTPLRTGDVSTVGGTRVTVVDSGVEGPARVRFEFDRDVASATWVVETYGGFRDLELPAVGFGAKLDVAQP